MSSRLLSKNTEHISIVLCGQAGQGIQTVEFLLTRILKLAGYNVFATKEYMSRIRGGTNSTEIRVSSAPVRAFVSRIDVLVALNKGAVEHVEKRILPGTLVLAEKESLGEDFDRTRCNCIDVQFGEIAANIGNKLYSNIVAVGTITGLLGLDLGTVSTGSACLILPGFDTFRVNNLSSHHPTLNLKFGLVFAKVPEDFGWRYRIVT